MADLNPASRLRVYDIDKTGNKELIFKCKIAWGGERLICQIDGVRCNPHSEFSCYVVERNKKFKKFIKKHNNTSDIPKIFDNRESLFDYIYDVTGYIAYFKDKEEENISNDAIRIDPRVLRDPETAKRYDEWVARGEK